MKCTYSSRVIRKVSDVPHLYHLLSSPVVTHTELHTHLHLWGAKQ